MESCGVEQIAHSSEKVISYDIPIDTLLKNSLDAIDEITLSADLWIEAPLSRVKFNI